MYISAAHSSKVKMDEVIRRLDLLDTNQGRVMVAARQGASDLATEQEVQAYATETEKKIIKLKALHEMHKRLTKEQKDARTETLGSEIWLRQKRKVLLEHQQHCSEELLDMQVQHAQEKKLLTQKLQECNIPADLKKLQQLQQLEKQERQQRRLQLTQQMQTLLLPLQQQFTMLDTLKKQELVLQLQQLEELQHKLTEYGIPGIQPERRRQAASLLLDQAVQDTRHLKLEAELQEKQAVRKLEIFADVATSQKVKQKRQQQQLERQVELSQLLHQINALQDEINVRRGVQQQMTEADR